MKGYLYGASAEYALHSLLILLGRTEPVSVRDLARFQQLPGRFLAKLFTRLKEAEIVDGIEGIGGGFSLVRPPGQISVMDVLDAIDPNRALFECAEVRRHCDLFGSEPPAWCVTGPCRIQLVMREAERALRSVLSSKSLADLGKELGHRAPERFMRDAENWFERSRSERNSGRCSKGGPSPRGAAAKSRSPDAGLKEKRP